MTPAATVEHARTAARPRAAAAVAPAQPVEIAAGAIGPDDLRELMRTVHETTERLHATHVALQGEVERLRGELAEAHARLDRSRALAALGEMAAGIAHEIRNPLASIRLYAQLLADEIADAAPPSRGVDAGDEADERDESAPSAAGLCERIERAVVGLDAIVRDVLRFARDTTPRTAPCSLHEIRDRALEDCRGLLEESGTIVALEGGDEDLEADAGLLVQALGNVIRNGVDAMADVPAGARRLVVRTGTTRVLDPAGRRAERLVLEVEDAGAGISPEIAARMFNPFFTTRATGTGLGLAIVHRIVDAHGGDLETSRGDAAGGTAGTGGGRPGGAVITIRLPRHPRPSRITGAASGDGSAPTTPPSPPAETYGR